MEGREHEFIGIGLIVGGLLLALATFFNLAGPLGRGARTVLAWLFGFGLIAVPIVLIAVGVSLVRKGRSASPMRLIIGWSLVALATLGLLHVFGGPQSFTDLDELDDAGGLLGALVGEPLEALLATGGAAVLLIGVVIGGALLITQTSLRTMAARTGSTVSTVARPLGRAARQALRGSLLAQQRRARRARRARRTPTQRLPCRSRLPPPTLYDAAADFDDDVARDVADVAAPPPQRITAPPSVAAPGPVDGDGRWTLPPMNLLRRTSAHTINRAEVEARGQCPRGVAPAARRRHVARGHDGRPDGHPLRARARSRRQGRSSDEPPTRHRLCDGGHRRAHPCSDSRSLGDRCRGPQPHPSPGRAR